MENMPLIKEKMETVHLGITPPVYLDRESARQELNIPNDIFAIGTIAELHPIKGLVYAIDAVSKTEFPFVYSVIGEGSERKIIETEIKKHNLENKISLKGFIDNAPKLLKAFDVFVLSSLSEAFGYVLLESAFANVPIIASRVGGIPEIIHEGAGILVPSMNSIELQKALIKIHENKPESRKMAVNMNIFASQNFSKNKMLVGTINVYETK
jgi:glycosyltransferase involved in cell wall biosynthesis